MTLLGADHRRGRHAQPGARAGGGGRPADRGKAFRAARAVVMAAGRACCRCRSPRSIRPAIRFAPPWPRLVVGCGRRSIGPALAVKRLSGGRTLAAYVQNPEFGREKFDLVAAMPHDGVTGPNVVTVGDRAASASRRSGWRARASEWREPARRRRQAVPRRARRRRQRRLSPDRRRSSARLLRMLETAHARARASRGDHAIAAHRRDAPSARSANALAAEGWAGSWDGDGANPYLGILALADRLIVTGESISMISEALATGRPVHVLPLEGQGRRHDAFLTRIVDEGLRLADRRRRSRLELCRARAGQRDAGGRRAHPRICWRSARAITRSLRRRWQHRLLAERRAARARASRWSRS